MAKLKPQAFAVFFFFCIHLQPTTWLMMMSQCERVSPLLSLLFHTCQSLVLLYHKMRPGPGATVSNLTLDTLWSLYIKHLQR